MAARIKLNAIDRDSSRSCCKFILVNTARELRRESKWFDDEVTYRRFYRDDEVLECPDRARKHWEELLEELSET